MDVCEMNVRLHSTLKTAEVQGGAADIQMTTRTSAEQRLQIFVRTSSFCWKLYVQMIAALMRQNQTYRSPAWFQFNFNHVSSVKSSTSGRCVKYNVSGLNQLNI